MGKLGKYFQIVIISVHVGFRENLIFVFSALNPFTRGVIRNQVGAGYP